MASFTITEDFPKKEIEFDQRFSTPQACYEYLIKHMWRFTTRKTGINATTLKAPLGFGSYGTAWCWLQKPRRCTIRQDREKRSVRVDVDEMFIGGKKSGKKGRGAEGKTIVAVVVER
jgi:hypothetical protein